MTNTKNAKYRVQNERGEFDVVHFETSMTQVKGLNDAMDEKAVKSEVNEHFRQLGQKVTNAEGVASGINTRLGQAEKTITSNTQAIQAEVKRAQGVEQGLETRLATAEGKLNQLGETSLEDLKNQVETNKSGLAAEIERAQRIEAGLRTDVDLKATKAEFEAEKERVNGQLGLKATTAQFEEYKRTNDAAVKAKADAAQVTQDIATCLSNANSYADQKKSEAIEQANENIQLAHTNLDEKIDGVNEIVSGHTKDIQSLKQTIGNKNSKTLVYATMEEFEEAAPGLHPKKGDLAFVVNIKKAFIYKEEDAAIALGDVVPPQGWMFFDEISTELDLSEYAKTADVTRQVNEVDSKITKEVSRATAKEKDIDAKADRAISNIAAEVIARGTAIKQAVSESENKLNTKIEGIVTVGGSQPSGKAQNHIWIEFLN